VPRAGFYAIHNSTIRFGCDGRWYADGQPIANVRIARLFSQSVHRTADGTYELRVAEERAPITVDDTAYVVTGAAVDDAGAVWIDLNDETREALDAASLAVGADDVLYCRVKDGAEWARFLRAAYYQLGDRIAADSAGGFVLRTAAGRFPIGRR
jgi:uncharacterized protein